MTILGDVKFSLRITIDDFDGEMQDLIDAAKADLGLSGVIGEQILDNNPLIKRAITTYCKANFGYDNPDADRLQKAYDLLKVHLTLTEDYACYSVTFTVTADGVPVKEAAITINDETTDKTNSQGVAIFKTTKSGIDLDYVISKTGYNDSEGIVYVDSSKTVEVELSAA